MTVKLKDPALNSSFIVLPHAALQFSHQDLYIHMYIFYNKLLTLPHFEQINELLAKIDRINGTYSTLMSTKAFVLLFF